MNLKILIPLASILLLSFIGCKYPSNSKEVLIGKYSFNRDVNDSIFIYPDNTYVHQFTSFKNEVYECKGIWRYDSIQLEILFKNFIFFNGDGAGNLPPGNWFAKVKTTNTGEVHLIYSAEDNIHYSKIH